MHSEEQARARWDATFSCGTDLSELRSAVRSSNGRNPCDIGLRSVCWKAFLVFENLDRSTWPKTIDNSRSAYASLKEHFLRGIRDPDAASAVDPLTDDDASPWKYLRQDELIREEILQDVERCMPDNSFFREPATQDLLLDILFIFCKLNADIGYRQGMHELLAPILWVVSRDAIDVEVQSPRNEGDLLNSVLDRRYIEHDVFTLFCIVMQTAKSFYETVDGSHSSSSLTVVESPIVVRSRRIHEKYLRSTDPELTEHLTAIDILPQIFVIRWIRLLFGREFPLDNVLNVWDVLFAEDPGLNLVDLVCVAMLLRIRWQLLEADYTSALTLLLRYPAPSASHPPMTFVEDALYLSSHLNREGGRELITKYTGGAPAKDRTQARASISRRKSLRTPHGSTDLGRGMPIRSPSQFLQDSGGLEGILQEAAKGVYHRGEKWGVNQALRGAVQQLQAANSSPRRSLSNIRRQFDDNSEVSAQEKQFAHRIVILEERNKALAKMLHDAMEDLTAQARKFEETKAEEEANALTLAVARLQFIHIYLENSSLPLNDEPGGGSEDQPTSTADNDSTKPGPEGATDTASRPDKTTTPKPPGSKTTPGSSKPLPQAPKVIPESPTRTYVPPRRRQTPKQTPSKSLANPESETSPFQQPRPSLAQSSFSFMLGEDHSKADFVTASPFTPESERRQSSESNRNSARKKASFLFGEDKRDKRDKDDSKPGGPRRREDEEGDDGFTMGTLSAPGSTG